MHTKRSHAERAPPSALTAESFGAATHQADYITATFSAAGFFLAAFVQWLMTAHVRRYHRHYHGSGHVWQGRFKAFPIEQDEHLLTVLRYGERNPLRAKRVQRAEEWAWPSLSWRPTGKRPELLSDGPIMVPRNWVSLVNKPQTEDEVAAMQRSLARGTPFGSERWTKRIATRLGLESTLNPRGRPRKYPNK